MKLNIAKTFTISLAFLPLVLHGQFTTPLFLYSSIGNEHIAGLIKSSTVLGVIMTLDNFLV